MLLFSGGGDTRQTARINTFFASIIEKDRPLLYIPLAGDPRFRSYETCLNYVKAVFRLQGIREVMMWTNLDSKTLKDLSRFSAIYISGGSADKLLGHFRGGFGEVLHSYFYHDGTIYGQSAGAIVLGKTIDILQQLNSDIYGLDLIYGFFLTCHFQMENSKIISKYVQHNQQPVIALPQGTALYQKDNALFHRVGLNPAYLFLTDLRKPVEWRT
ncbi:Type 1 glutamine amidotransferase-like domain-containing protein [Sporolactobacillus shoreicorticis]|uniref:Type 1 glutamine amidotransferase-like domain-containing protein n=1 Tax=Sporolactobacillus shoreicorticis TaxID=1923877 RepID=A0ABW5S8L7_9BACL|nr:Type 1 glutamine amidotransferase-like domain-containing protein [Sporolactobacillus shoreicorticis]MCO7126873.1 Type 1 glutamine amidotransferase-like domain-containing protein [Sporolactobacillus shoreicorticis]